MEFTYELLDDRVALLPDPADDKTSGGLLLSKSAKKRPDTGVVIAVGKGVYATDSGILIPMWVQVGDRVIFDKFQFEDFEGFLLGRESNIKAIIKPAP